MGFFTEGSIIMNILSKSGPLKLKHLNDGYVFVFLQTNSFWLL